MSACPLVQCVVHLFAVCCLLFSPLVFSADIASPRVLDERVELRLFASEPAIVTPVGLDVDAHGRVWVIESNTHFPPEDYARHRTDRILVFTDRDDDGASDEHAVFTDGLAQSMGLRLLDDRHLLVATRREILLFEDRDGDLRSDARRQLVRLETEGDYPHNGLSGFEVDDLGNVWFGMGENLGVDYRIVGADGRSYAGGGEGGNVWRVDSDGRNLRWWSTGFWNPFHLAFTEFGELFTVDNDPDSRPPCRLLHVIRGGDYGYRFRLGRKGLHPFSSWNGRHPGSLPMAAGTGEAPSGILSYEFEGLPKEYRGALLVTSWGDHRIEVYDLARSGPASAGATPRATFSATRRVLVEGDESFRPVGIGAARDGSVFISDWVDESYNVHLKGRIWRLRSKGPPEPTAIASSPLVSLGHASKSLRSLAIASLARDAGAVGRVRSLLRSKDASNRARASALRVLLRRRELDSEDVESLVEGGASDRLLAFALRSLAEISDEARRACIPALLRNDRFGQRSLARSEALLACDDSRQLTQRFFELAAPGSLRDPFLVSAALDALARGASGEELLAAGKSPDASQRLVALLVHRRRGGTGELATPFVEKLQPVGSEVVADFLEDEDPSVRLQAMRWVGEERIAELGEALDRSLRVGPVTGDVLDAWLAARELLEGKDARERDKLSRDAFLLSLVVDTERDAGLRVHALRSISIDFAGWDASLVGRLLTDPSTALRIEMARTLAATRVAGARALLEAMAARTSESRAARRQALIALSSYRPESRPALVTALDDADPVLRREAARGLRGAEFDAMAADKRRRLDPRRSEAEPKRASDAWWRAALDGGDADEGELVFHHPQGARCSRCHTVDGRGGPAGPDLSTAGKMSTERLLDSIRRPALEIAPQFSTWTLVLDAGDVLSGVLLEPAPDGRLRIAAGTGQVHRVDPGRVVDRRLEKTSLMPEQLADELSLRELRDLIAYLRARR